MRYKLDSLRIPLVSECFKFQPWLTDKNFSTQSLNAHPPGKGKLHSLALSRGEGELDRIDRLPSPLWGGRLGGKGVQLLSVNKVSNLVPPLIRGPGDFLRYFSASGGGGVSHFCHPESWERKRVSDGSQSLRKIGFFLLRYRYVQNDIFAKLRCTQ